MKLLPLFKELNTLETIKRKFTPWRRLWIFVILFIKRQGESESFSIFKALIDGFWINKWVKDYGLMQSSGYHRISHDLLERKNRLGAKWPTLAPSLCLHIAPVGVGIFSCLSVSPLPVCVVQGLEYEDGATWKLEDGQCTTCTCVNGDTICRPKQCPAVNCLHPSSNNGTSKRKINWVNTRHLGHKM